MVVTSQIQSRSPGPPKWGHPISSLFQVDAFVFVPGDGGADLRRALAQLGLLIGEKAFLGAGGALRAVKRFEAAPQAGMTESAVATAIAGKLVNHAADFGGLFINVDLPG